MLFGLLVVPFVRFFAFGELGRVIGTRNLAAMFFAERRTVDE